MSYDEDGGEGLGSNMQRPACQVAECFEPVSVYVVIKESDIKTMRLDTREKQLFVEKNSPGNVNAFKLISFLRAPRL